MYEWKKGQYLAIKERKLFLTLWQSNQYEGFAWNLSENVGMGGKRSRGEKDVVPQPTSKSGSMELP